VPTPSTSTLRPEVPRRQESWLDSRPALLLAALTVLLGFAALLGLVQAGWQPLQAFDRAVTHGLHDHVSGRPGLVAVTEAVTLLGDRLTWWLLTAAATAWLLARRRAGSATFVAVAGLGGGLLNRAVKEAVGRPRPDLAEPASQASGLAFPSGHAMASAVGVAALLLVLPPVLAPHWRRPGFGGARRQQPARPRTAAGRGTVTGPAPGRSLS